MPLPIASARSAWENQSQAADRINDEAGRPRRAPLQLSGNIILCDIHSDGRVCAFMISFMVGEKNASSHISCSRLLNWYKLI